MSFAITVRVIMVEKGISALQLAKNSGLNRSSLSRALTNEFNPKLENLRLIAKGLDMKLSELIARDEQYRD